MPATDLTGRIELSYVISVHKAQGSQFKRVAIAVSKSRLFDHALLYTALTRGVEQVVFVSDRAAFGTGVVHPPSAQRRDVAMTI